MQEATIEMWIAKEVQRIEGAGERKKPAHRDAAALTHAVSGFESHLPSTCVLT